MNHSFSFCVTTCLQDNYTLKYILWDLFINVVAHTDEKLWIVCYATLGKIASSMSDF